MKSVEVLNTYDGKKAGEVAVQDRGEMRKRIDQAAAE